MDWSELSTDIYNVLVDLGSEIIVKVPSSTTRSATGKKSLVIYTDYSGIAVKGKYDSEFIKKNESIIQAGDVKFVCQFDNSDFEPTKDKDMTLVYGNKNYKIENVDSVEPDGTTVIVYIIQGRRVN